MEGCSIAVDATFFIQTMLDAGPAREPLMAALGGVTGFQKNMGIELDQWAANNVTPFFVFDGQPVVGQEDVAIEQGLRDIAKTDTAWDLYFGSRATEAVTAFGEGCKSCSLPCTSLLLLTPLSQSHLPCPDALSGSAAGSQDQKPTLHHPAIQRRCSGMFISFFSSLLVSPSC